MTITICYISKNEVSVGALEARSSPNGTFTYEAIIGHVMGGIGVGNQIDRALLDTLNDFRGVAQIFMTIDPGSSGQDAFWGATFVQ